jgi:hypothetical protein
LKIDSQRSRDLKIAVIEIVHVVIDEGNYLRALIEVREGKRNRGD